MREIQKKLIREGVIGGLIAGAVFAIVAMIVKSPEKPWEIFASTLLGKSAVTSAADVGTIALGFSVHFALSALYGLVWGAATSALPARIRDSWGVHSLAATAYGFAIYVVNFEVFAKLFYPWLRQGNALTQILLHAFAFGLPLGLYLVAHARPVDRRLQGRKATAWASTSTQNDRSMA